MLIDSAHLEEIRVAVTDGDKLDKFDFETPLRTQIKGNIYLGKIVRVEPSLQAAFVDFGCEKHGFLSFSEIHHDYFQIPVGDREELEARIQTAMAEFAEESDFEEGELDSRAISKLRYQFYRRYKIQEVIKKRQIMLVQVTKEERGNKGAALTTYVSLAGRYCVLMPNMSKGSGVSRKISNPKDREKLKKIVSEFEVNNGSAVIRTAGIGHSKLEIKKDFDYLTKSWDEIREITLKSTAPSMIYEEANIIKRAIRDLYSRDVESIIVEGEEGYRIVKDFVKKLMPSHSKKVKLYYDKKVPLFSKYKINDQVNQIYSTRVDLPSGGYIIVNTTEALISIDVNSGKSTRERNIGGTALKTNLEAASEIARQCRLRDLAGLIVVDFIDMEEKRNNGQVEKCLRDSLREDKAKIQIGVISNFGLLEFSRQRLRSSIVDANMVMCPHCSGVGYIWSDESIALQILRKIEETCLAMELEEVDVTLSTDVALYLLNNKRSFISSIENRGLKIAFKIDTTISAADFKISPVTRAIQKREDPRAAAPNIVEKNQNNDTRKQQVNNENNARSDRQEISDKDKEDVSKETTEENPVTYPTRPRRNNRRRNNRRNTNEAGKVADISTEETTGDEKSSDEKSDNVEQSKIVFDLNIKKTPKEDISIKENISVDEDAPIKEVVSASENIPAEHNETYNFKDLKNEKSRRNNTRRREPRTEDPKKNQNDLVENHDKPANKEEVVVNEVIDFSEGKSELMELARTYRELEQELEQIGHQEFAHNPMKKTRKDGWWQRLIKKPTDQEKK